MKKSLITGMLLAVILIAGVSLLAYPFISDSWNRFHQTHVVMNYADTVDQMEKEEYQRVLEAAYAYNAKLAERGLDWDMDEAEQKDYDAQLDVDPSGIMGYVNIPKIHVMLPVYHGTDESILQTAAGHLEGTSLPVGSKERSTGDESPSAGSHCVISGHRGLPSAKLFTDLDRLTEGDRFSMTVLNETVTYEVDQIRVVEPTDLSDLQIVPGEDFCTLLTCTPYGINTHRLLVRGHRIAGTMDDAAGKSLAFPFWPGLVIAMAAVFGLLFLLIVLMIVTRKRKTNGLFKMLVIAVALMLLLPVGTSPAKAAGADVPFSLTVHMANEAFIKEDPQLRDVTLEIYRLADPDDWERKMAMAQTGFDTKKAVSEKGYYLVVPMLGDEVETDDAGNAVVRTENWVYTFSPMVIAIPAKDPTEIDGKDAAAGYGDCTDAVIYAKADRRSVHGEAVVSTRDVRTGDMPPLLPVAGAFFAISTLAIVLWKKRSGA